MRQRLNGMILRGETTYYTFQRFSTALGYLARAEAKGEKVDGYNVTYAYNGELIEQTARDFRKVAPRLIETQAKNGKKALAKKEPVAKVSKVKTLTGRGARVKLDKQATKKAPAKRRSRKGTGVVTTAMG